DATSRCEFKRVAGSRPMFCAIDSRLAKDVAGAKKRLERELGNCNEESLSNLCAFGQRNSFDLTAKLATADDGAAATLGVLVRHLFVEPIDEKCVRPGWDASREAEDCGKVFSQKTTDLIEELQGCFFECEMKQLKQNEPLLCVDPNTGAPLARKVNDCLNKEIREFFEYANRRCQAVGITDLGCPMGQVTAEAAATAATTEILLLAEKLNLEIFHSNCRAETDIVVPTSPSTITLLPSGDRAYLACGQIVDSAFMQGDSILMLDGPINCDAASGPVDGLLIAASGITVDGRGNFGIIGPDRSRYRTGAGIRVLPDAQNVTLQNLKSVRRFGVGIADSGSNPGLRVINVDLRRNEIAGVTISSSKVVLDSLYSDRNEIGVSVEGDNIIIRSSVIRRSGGGRGLGVQILGEDSDEDGVAVAFLDTFLEHNGTGMVVGGRDHQIAGSRITRSRYTGIEVQGSAITIEDSIVRDSRNGHGLEIRGSDNLVRGMLIEKSGLAGFAVSGSRNLLRLNSAGDIRRGNGNKGGGFVITGSLNSLGSNAAYRNRPVQFSIGRNNVDLGGNSADGDDFNFDDGNTTID
ncbi:MAG: right-handed parallel beta-helix repeat-containing protein, partial [bacterium]